MFISIALLLVVVALPLSLTFAQFSPTTKRPFGGKVLSTTVPAVVCVAQYSLMVRPVVTSPIGTPYFIRTTTKPLRPGSWTLGWYNPVVDMNTCKTTSAPPVPVPAFELKY